MNTAMSIDRALANVLAIAAGTHDWVPEPSYALVARRHEAAWNAIRNFRNGWNSGGQGRWAVIRAAACRAVLSGYETSNPLLP